MEAQQENNTTAESQNLLIQNTIDALVQITEKHVSVLDEDIWMQHAWPTKKAKEICLNSLHTLLPVENLMFQELCQVIFYLVFFLR